jgi:hypothetical protein
VRHLIPKVYGIGPVRLAEIDAWLRETPDTVTAPDDTAPRTPRR